MKKIAIEIMERQLQERKEAATNIVNNTIEALKVLGQEELLSSNVVEVKIPVEIDKSELENLQITNEESQAIIKGLKKELANEKRRATNNTKKVDKLKEQVSELKSDVKQLNKISKENKKLLEEKKQLQDMIAKLEAKLNMKINAEFKVPVNNKETIKEQAPVQINNDLKIYLNNNISILGQYKNVIFEASKRMDAITIYDPSMYGMKDEINKALESAKLFTQARDVKDHDRIESEIGSCHAISKTKYMGFVMDNGKAICYVYEPSKYDTAKVILINKRLNNTSVKYEPASEAQQTLINSLVAQHVAANNKRMEQISQDAYVGLGLDFLDGDNNQQTVNNSTPSVNLNFTKQPEQTESSTNGPEEDMMAEFARILGGLNA